ncbi:hypothetical protein JZM25_25120 [Escherichia coli]|uniref:hypothetical protein n=1 Tax=Escherichia coli TaxID=562 RepID=UPI0019D04F55|nr:hypothetical protein [Escherichia coli]MBN6398527.1 hypothetical protein [Escherichia coli]
MLTVFLKSGKSLCLGAGFSVLLLVSEVVHAGNTASFTVPLTLKITRPTCTATISGVDGGSDWDGTHTYSLGTLTRDKKRYPPINLKLSCPGATAADSHAVFRVRVRQGDVDTSNRIMMLLNGQKNDSAPRLFFTVGNTRLDLSGATPFCDTDVTKDKTCEVVPNISFPATVLPFVGGQVSATVVFNWEWK